MSAEILLTIILGIMGVAASFAFGYYFATRKKKIHQKIKELDRHLEYVSKLRKSAVELNRKAFIHFFLVLFCLSIGLGAPVVGEYLTQGISVKLIELLVTSIQLAAFITGGAISIAEFRVYGDISNYQKAVEE